jgi:hypothetical protein
MDDEAQRFAQLKLDQEEKRQKMRERHQRSDMDNYDMGLPHEDSEDSEDNEEVIVNKLIVNQNDPADMGSDGKGDANED